MSAGASGRPGNIIPELGSARMGIAQLAQLRGLNPTKTIANALRTYVSNDKLPSIPNVAIADG